MTAPTKATQSTATKSAQADTRKDESAAAQANRTQPFDFGALTIVDEETRPTRKTRNAGDDQQVKALVEALRASWEKRDASGYGSGKAVIVPTNQAKRLETMIRKAAVMLSEEVKTDIGTNVSTVKLDDGKSKVSFAAKPKKVYSR